MVDKGAQSAWLAAVLLGAVAAVVGVVIPATGLPLAAAVTVLVLVLRGPRQFGIGGAWLGFGGMWSVLLGRAAVDCVLGPASSDGCESSVFQAYLVIGIVLAGAGLLISAAAFRGRPAA